MESFERILVLVVLLWPQSLDSVPVSVPIDNSYPNNFAAYNQQPNYFDTSSDGRPNAYFNRLPPNSNSDQIQVDDVDHASSDNDDYDDYDDQQTDKPVINTSNQQSALNNYNNNNNFNYLLTENRVKFKKRRKRRRPCIPIQSFGSPLFSNRLKRDVRYDPETGKTLHFVLGDINYNQQQRPGNYPFDNVKPQYDTGSNSGSGQIQYHPYGGYPCIPVSYGHHHRPSGGPFGFFGQGGLFDFGGGQQPAIADAQYPVYRPPYNQQGHRPPFQLQGNRPQYPQDSQGSASDVRPGFWGTVVDKLQDFVSRLCSLR